jgi:uncharacterized RDD family membrane protein YckC
LSFYFVFLIGSLMYAKYGEQEKKLLRFCFAVILCNGVIEIPMILTGFAQILGGIKYQVSLYSFFLFCKVFNIFLTVYSFNLLKKWQNESVLCLEKSEDLENVSYFVSSAKIHRFVHFIFDLLIVFVCFNAYIYIFRHDLVKISEVIGEKGTLILFLGLCRVIYHTLFEWSLNATPGKYLTGSRVVENDAEPLSIEIIFKRSIYRLVPFEALSYLGKYNGWHDQWSNTDVVKEESKGVNGNRYLLVILATLLFAYSTLVIATYFDNKAQEKHTSDIELDFLDKRKKLLNNLNSDYILFPKVEKISQNQSVGSAAYNESSSEYERWRIERIEGDTVVCSILKFENYPNEKEIRMAYKNQNGRLEYISISKDDIDGTLPKKQYGDVDMLINASDGKRRFGIKSIQAVFGLDLEIQDGTSQKSLENKDKDVILLGIRNKGADGEMIKVETLEGAAICRNKIPTKINNMENATYENNYYFQLELDNCTLNEPYKVLLTFQNKKGNQSKFIVSGEGFSAKISPF